MENKMKLRNLLAMALILIAGVMPAQTALKFKQKILVTSAGQSADMKMVSLMLKKLKIETTENGSATSSNLNDIQTLLIVPGFSSKGLGAAGISQEQELNRVKELIAAANKKNIKILCVHVGGNARRKGQSDLFNEIVAASSKAIIVVKQGDEDKYFTNIAAGKKIPVKVVEKIADVAVPLGEFFN